jgi:hypothetical protein
MVRSAACGVSRTMRPSTRQGKCDCPVLRTAPRLPFVDFRDDGLLPVICPTCQTVSQDAQSVMSTILFHFAWGCFPDFWWALAKPRQRERERTCFVVRKPNLISSCFGIWTALASDIRLRAENFAKLSRHRYFCLQNFGFVVLSSRSTEKGRSYVVANADRGAADPGSVGADVMNKAGQWIEPSLVSSSQAVSYERPTRLSILTIFWRCSCCHFSSRNAPLSLPATNRQWFWPRILWLKRVWQC